MRGACLPVTLLSGGCRVWCDPEGAAAFVAVAFALADGAVFFFLYFFASVWNCVCIVGQDCGGVGGGLVCLIQWWWMTLGRLCAVFFCSGGRCDVNGLIVCVGSV